MNEIEKAEQTLANLEDKRQHLIQKATELADERQRISFAAHAGGDKKARQRLDEINVATASHQSEMASIEAAINEGQARLASVQREADAVADRERAIKARDLVKKLVECGQELDNALADAVAWSQDMQTTLREMHHLGFANPTDAQLKVAGEFAIKAALMKMGPWDRSFEFLPPGRRTTFVQVVAAWSGMLTSQIEARIGDKKPEAA
jgi:hypothetical protein